MSRFYNKIKSYYTNNRDFCLYTATSISTTAVDITLSFVTEFVFPVLIANAIGSITGFLLHYIIVSKHVFHSRSKRTFYVFLITFILSLIVAEVIIWIFRHLIFRGSTSMMKFGVSKATSMIIPFFITYRLRKKLI